MLTILRILFVCLNLLQNQNQYNELTAVVTFMQQRKFVVAFWQLLRIHLLWCYSHTVMVFDMGQERWVISYRTYSLLVLCQYIRRLYPSLHVHTYLRCHFSGGLSWSAYGENRILVTVLFKLLEHAKCHFCYSFIMKSLVQTSCRQI